jgi:hypothetical protein
MVIQAPDTAKMNKWNDQYNRWIYKQIATHNIEPSLNGIAFIPTYKDWVAISSTDRIDNGTMRIIMGNAVAVKAIKTNHTNPWPDGSAFAKLLWVQVGDSSGNINSGEFKQVDFMTKNKQLYTQTNGWGYSRWLLNKKLVPYGENSLFSTGCVNCHQSMKEHDYVFTTPVNITADHALEDKVLCSSINKKDSTMTTLYGNDIASGFARNQPGNEYPAGSSLTLVTWAAKEDEHWFGGVIPGDIKSIEKIRFIITGKNKAKVVYEMFQGKSLRKAATDKLNELRRINLIVNMRASVMP